MKTYVITLSKTFPAYHPRKGEDTFFLSAVLCGTKKHTIRANYDWWKKRLDEVNVGRAVLSLRQWTGKPYNSKQKEFAELTSLAYQEFEFKYLSGQGCVTPLVDGKIIDPDDFIDLCENDGLVNSDFLSWFKYPKPFKGIMIHFTDLRY